MKWKWFNDYNPLKPNITFLHGFLEDSTTWLPFLTEISETYNCLLIDFPFCKTPNAKQQEISFGAITLEIVSLFNFLDINKTHLICHSMGGYFGCYLKNLEPNIVSKVILCNSVLQSDKRDQKLKRKKIKRVIQSNFVMFCKMCFNKYKTNSTDYNKHIDFKIERALIQDPNRLCDFQVLIEERPNFYPVFEKHNKDFFFIFGENDEDIPWKSELPTLKKRYHIISNEKHILPLNSIEEWTKKILSHLE